MQQIYSEVSQIYHHLLTYISVSVSLPALEVRFGQIWVKSAYSAMAATIAFVGPRAPHLGKKIPSKYTVVAFLNRKKQSVLLQFKV